MRSQPAKLLTVRFYTSSRYLTRDLQSFHVDIHAWSYQLKLKGDTIYLMLADASPVKRVPNEIFWKKHVIVDQYEVPHAATGEHQSDFAPH